MINPREIALDILFDIFHRGGYSNLILNKKLKYIKEARDKNFIREIVYGVIENDIYLEFLISKLSKIKISKIHNKILLILKMGLYQKTFMDKIPDNAVANEMVELAKKHGNKGSVGFVNGLLRNFIRNFDDFTNLSDLSGADYISIKYSHPRWMVEKWIEDYGLDFTESLCKANNNKPDFTIRVNTLKISKEDLEKKLKSYGTLKSKYSRDSFILSNPTDILDSEEYRRGYFSVQDESSSLVGQIMNPRPGSLVLDVCSGPGGKASHLAEIMANKGQIIGFDIYDHKLKLIRDNATRLGIKIIDARLGDGSQFNPDYIEFADYVLVDAPCSGLGIIRRKPEIKNTKSQDQISSLIEIQKKILNNSKFYVKEGGILVYSTCTINKDENINLINDFLNKNDNFSLLAFEEDLGDGLSGESGNKGYIQLFPNIHNTDGFFIAKMRKISK